MWDKIMDVIGIVVLVAVGLVMLYHGITYIAELMFG